MKYQIHKIRRRRFRNSLASRDIDLAWAGRKILPLVFLGESILEENGQVVGISFQEEK